VSAPALRPRSVTELVDAAFQLVRLHYVQFVSISAVFLIPAILVQALFARSTGPFVIPSATGTTGQTLAPGAILPFTLVALVVGLLGLLGTAAVVVGVSDSYVHDRVDVGQAVRRVLGRFGPIIGGAVGQALAMAISAFILVFGAMLVVGVLVLVLPKGTATALMGVLVVPIVLIGEVAVFARVFAVPMVIVLEGGTVGHAFSRSLELTRGSVGRVIGVLVLTGLIFLALFGAILFFIGYLSAVAPRGGPMYAVLSSVINIFAYPIYTVFITLLYYDLRIRKDGFDLEVMSRELMGAAPAVPA